MLQTCRFCHEFNGIGEHAHSRMVRYGRRRSAHLECIASSGRARKILSKAHMHELTALPLQELLDCKLSEIVVELFRTKANRGDTS